jgi:hypothetical protein
LLRKQVPDGFKGLIMLCIRRKPEERPPLSKIRRLLHRITISFIDKQKQNIDREIEREFSSLFEDASELVSPLSVEVSPQQQSSGRYLAVTDDMRVEQKPATMCARSCWCRCCCYGVAPGFVATHAD